MGLGLEFRVWGVLRGLGLEFRVWGVLMGLGLEFRVWGVLMGLGFRMGPFIVGPSVVLKKLSTRVSWQLQH
jgi:hypothetical protein